MKATLKRRPERGQRKLRRGDVIWTRWVGPKRKVEVLEGPYIGEVCAECDCSHWEEIIESLGDNYAF